MTPQGIKTINRIATNPQREAKKIVLAFGFISGTKLLAIKNGM
jgi:hypothetical protein